MVRLRAGRELSGRLALHGRCGNHDGSSRRHDRTRLRILRVVAASAALLLSAAPLRAHADPLVNGSVVESSVCQISSMTMTMTPAVGMSVSTGPDGYSLSGSGSCTGIVSGPFQVDFGSGGTVGPVSCASMLSGDGTLNMFIGTSPYTASITVSGAGGAVVLTVRPMSVSLGTSAAGEIDLALSTASMQACQLPGGTTTLQYSGTAAFVIV